MASYLVEARTLVLHIPRTGGTWRQHADRDCKIRSKRLRKSKHVILPFHSAKQLALIDRIATFVRHPKELYESTFRYLSKVNNIKWFSRRSSRPINPAAKQFVPDFQEWVERMLNEEPGYITRQYESFIGPENAELCWYIGRTETLNTDYPDMLKRLGYDVDANEIIKRQPKNRTPDIRCDWKTETLMKMIDMEWPVIRRFYGDNKDKRLFANVWGKVNK